MAAASFALAACNSGEEAAEAPAVDEAMVADEPAAEVALAADGQPATGTYEVTLADGSVITEIVNADGTMSWISSDGTEGSGTWRTDGPNVWCSTDEGEAETCSDEVVGEDGVWTSINRESGNTAIVVRADS
ncbi:hypothetical protein AAV99_11540 [Aurantiacibacter marinus]|uniref:Uncharacterized protein n=1 Tax=Aurantiacibacter marinus TaxID=874156 RepID=A0A0H0XLV6_9SPHN|nr:hypothetical protein AAV99_11540 [Aurantiacibacter marinus]